MLSALSVAEFWRNEAAFLAASKRLRASCLCFSAEADEEVEEESALFSRPSVGRVLLGFFDAGRAALFSFCNVEGGHYMTDRKSVKLTKYNDSRLCPVFVQTGLAEIQSLRSFAKAVLSFPFIA